MVLFDQNSDRWAHLLIFIINHYAQTFSFNFSVFKFSRAIWLICGQYLHHFYSFLTKVIPIEKSRLCVGQRSWVNFQASSNEIIFMRARKIAIQHSSRKENKEKVPPFPLLHIVIALVDREIVPKSPRYCFLFISESNTDTQESPSVSCPHLCRLYQQTTSAS